VARWFRERADLSPLLSWAAKKTVPVHRSSWMYLFGGVALFLFTLQVISGGLLMLYYRPTEAEAHKSIKIIMEQVPYGWLIRSVHAWGADFFIALVFLHLVVKAASAAYRKPREMTWLSGVLLLSLALASGFSGYLLPWTELSYYATLVGTQIPGSLPVVGDWVVHLLRGGAQVTGDTITRFYAAHVFLLPLCYAVFLLVHLGLVQIQGQSLPLGLDPRSVRDNRPFFTEFLPLEFCLWLPLFGVIVSLAVLAPVAVGQQANPLLPAPEGIKPEWYFLFLFQTFKFVPEAVGILLSTFLGLFLLLLPFIDTRSARGQKRHPALILALFLIALWAVVFEIIALRAPGQAHQASAFGGPLPHKLVSLTLLWAVIAFLVYYLRQLAIENRRIRILRTTP